MAVNNFDIELENGVRVRPLLEAEAVEAVRAALLRGGKIGVACSGGADSVFALYCAAALAGGFSKIAVLHFNHKARAAAEDDEAFVRDLCARAGAEFVAGAPQRPPSKKTEGVFRQMRLAFFGDCAKKLGLCAIVQGHHANDVAETVLMRLMRGSSLDGLCAPRAVSKTGGAVYVRPLLHVKKSEIERWLALAGIAWRTDESNLEDDFLRNRIRHKAVPVLADLGNAYGRDFVLSCARSRSLMQEESDFLDSYVEKLLAKESGNEAWSYGGDCSAVSLGAEVLAHRALFRRAFMKFLAKNSLLENVRASLVDEFIKNALSAARGGASAVRVSAGAGVCVVFDAKEGRLFAQRETAAFCVEIAEGRNAIDGMGELCVSVREADSELLERACNPRSGAETKVYLDASCLCLSVAAKIARAGSAREAAAIARAALRDGALVARSRRAGDAYAPFGFKTPRKIKDIISSKKIGISERPKIFAVQNSDSDIVWCPLLPCAEAFKITQSSKAVIELTFAVRGC